MKKLLIVGAIMVSVLSGCAVYPAHHDGGYYYTPAPVVVRPAPVMVYPRYHYPHHHYRRYY